MINHGFDLESPIVCKGIIGDGCGGGRIFFVENRMLCVYDPMTQKRRTLLKDLADISKISKKACIISLEHAGGVIEFDLSFVKS